MLLDPSIEEGLSTFCGRSFDQLSELLNETVAIVEELSVDATRVIQLLGCDSIVPIYQSMVYDAGCEESLKAFMWTFSASFIMSFFGFSMITFRSAYSETLYIDVYDENAGRMADNEQYIVNPIDDDSKVINSGFRGEDVNIDEKVDDAIDNEENEKYDHDATSDSSGGYHNNNQDSNTQQYHNSASQLYDDEMKSTGRDDVVSVDNWTPYYQLEKKSVGDKLDSILDGLKHSRRDGIEIDTY
jgi:hypothetical protein